MGRSGEVLFLEGHCLAKCLFYSFSISLLPFFISTAGPLALKTISGVWCIYPSVRFISTLTFTCLKCFIYACATCISDDIVFSTSNISISISIYLYFYFISWGPLLSAKWFESSGPDPTPLCRGAHKDRHWQFFKSNNDFFILFFRCCSGKSTESVTWKNSEKPAELLPSMYSFILV